MENYTEILDKVKKYASSIGFNVVIKNNIDEYFKGDMDGVNIYCTDLDDEEELFNVLHMIGHCIQWNVSDELRALGSQLYKNPEPALLKRLQEYEWEANCYALYILHEVGCHTLDHWLYDKYIKDMAYLTHYYMTGEKLRLITQLSLQYSFIELLVPKQIPSFNPKQIETTRNGIVIDFDKM
jgi:hypothetical protein